MRGGSLPNASRKESRNSASSIRRCGSWHSAAISCSQTIDETGAFGQDGLPTLTVAQVIDDLVAGYPNQPGALGGVASETLAGLFGLSLPTLRPESQLTTGRVDVVPLLSAKGRGHILALQRPQEVLLH